MTAIRIAIQGNYADLDDQLPAMLKAASEAREQPGNLQAEIFRGNEFVDNVLYLQLWESLPAFDAFWEKLSASGDALFLTWQAPYHHGKTVAPRRHGENGIEIYRQALYGRADGGWGPADAAEQSKAVRFPAWSAVRIIIQMTMPAAPPSSAQLDSAQESRLEPGCLQFENFRSVEYPENACLMELWESPEIYDIHWLNRVVQQAPRPNQPPPPPRPAPMERRYGQPGFEWYAHTYYSLVDNVWLPEDPSRRMATVRW